MDFRLREILNERGITIRAFAQQMGVVANSLPVSVTYAPSLSALQKYARALNMPCVELVRKPEHPTPVTKSDMTDQFDLNEMVLSNIKRIAEEKKLSMKQIADGAGVSAPSLSLTLKKNKMTTATLEKIARGLDVEPWTLLVDAAAQPTPSAFDPHDPSEIQTVTDAVNNGLRADKPLGEQLNVGGSFEDLFAQQPEQQEEEELAKVLADGTYTYGGKRIVLRGGEIIIS